MQPTKSPHHVVAATPGDAATVFAMVRELAAHEGSLSAVTSDERRWREMLADPGVLVLVAVEHGEPIGFVSAIRRVHLRSGEHMITVDDLYVRPPWRNNGVGEGLMRALGAVAGALPLRWEVDSVDIAAQRFALRLHARLRRTVSARWDLATAAA